jgi:hypothetical protein
MGLLPCVTVARVLSQKFVKAQDFIAGRFASLDLNLITNLFWVQEQKQKP